MASIVSNEKRLKVTITDIKQSRAEAEPPCNTMKKFIILNWGTMSG